MNSANLHLELSIQEAHMQPLTIALVALAVACVAVAVTASALNAIAISQIETEPQRYNLTHGSAAKFGGSEPGYGTVRVTVPPGKKAFPAELVPVD
jgi:hypothetical protein